jgi:pimeloyl-ACP methyl ester carboxylesterase
VRGWTTIYPGGSYDASSWNPVIQRLERAGYTVDAPPNPLRGVSIDAQTIADFVSTIKGPVILVGHSYGGVVITNAATRTKYVRALVYDDAYIPAKRETVFQINAAVPGSCVAADPTTFLNLVPYPGSPAGDDDAYLKFAPNGSYKGFDDCFANGVPAAEARLLATGQRPFAVSAGSEPSGIPAWESLPSWAVVGTQDHVIPSSRRRSSTRLRKPTDRSTDRDQWGPPVPAPVPAARRGFGTLGPDRLVALEGLISAVENSEADSLSS